jgi:hypothetical protein
MNQLELLSREHKWVMLEQSLSTGRYEEVAQMLQCVHCQGLWEVKPGSGKRRGFCLRCNAPTCGRAGCDRCKPWEMACEIQEGRVSLASALHRIREL